MGQPATRRRYVIAAASTTDLSKTNYSVIRLTGQQLADHG